MIDGSLAFYLKHSAVDGGWVVGLVGGGSPCFNTEVENRVKLLYGFLKFTNPCKFEEDLHVSF